MRTIQFNFNNEADILVLNQEIETGVITIPGQDGLSFATIQMFAEYYATARNVAEDRLKNWVLIEDGTTYSFVLRAGTAGIAAEAIAEALDVAINEASEGFHVLVVEGFRNRLANAPDVIEALINDENLALAQLVYDRLVAVDALLEPEVDLRSELEIDLDTALEEIGTLALFAKALNLPLNAPKEAILTHVETTQIDFEARVASTVAALAEATEVGSFALLSALTIQEPVGIVDAEAITKIQAMAEFTRRSNLNIRTILVGERFVKDSFEYVDVAELSVDNVRIINNLPVQFKFDVEFDAQIEPEVIIARAARLAAEAEQRELMALMGAMMGQEMYYDED